LSRAPVALVALLGVAAVLGWVRPIGRWADRIRAQIEIAADAYALAHGSSRPAIALAIVKLSSPPSSPGIASFESAVETGSELSSVRRRHPRTPGATTSV